MAEKRIWEPDSFKLQTNTVWRFPDRGTWAVHNGGYRGNWSPYIPRNIILRYSKENDIVLDQFVGSGTTLIEAKLLNRRCIGIDVNRSALSICTESIKKCTEGSGKIRLYHGDARSLKFIPDNYVDLIATHPPYADIIKYSVDNPDDLSHLPYLKFLSEMELVAQESHRVLKQGKICTILIGDMRRHGDVIPLGFNIMQVFQKVGFKIKEIVIKEQFNCQSTNFWKNSIRERDFLLLAHEYLFVFRK